MKFIKISTLIFTVALLGAGCQWFGSPADPDARNTFGGLSPAEAAEKLQFLPGDTFDIEQRVYGFEALIPGFMKSDKGVRNVTITRFAPMHTANLDWETTLDVETEASKQAREEYRQALESLTDDREIPERPQPEYETRSTSGTIEFINIKDSHKALFPAYWQEGTQSAINTFSGIWLSDDAYQELSRTGKTVLSFNVFHESSAQAIRGVNELQSALETLRNESEEAKDGSTDIDLMEVTNDSLEYELTIDGSPVTVEAIKAKNWFGEITVLKNRQNPMILELNINPLAAGANEVMGEQVGSLQDLFGYKIDNFNLKVF